MPRTPPEAAPFENGDISSAASPEAVTTDAIEGVAVGRHVSAMA
jgi:hypothetical protein